MTTENSKPDVALVTRSQYAELAILSRFLSEFLFLVDEHQELELQATEIVGVILPLSNKLESFLEGLSEQFPPKQAKQTA